MATNNQFSIAIHIMASLGLCPDKGLSSFDLANSVNANASFIRRVLSKLSKAGLVQTITGKSGSCSLARKPSEINLLEIYRAIEAPKVFAIHDYPVQKTCTVSCSIKYSLENVLSKTQKSMEESLKKTSLSEVISDMKKKMAAT